MLGAVQQLAEETATSVTKLQAELAGLRTLVNAQNGHLSLAAGTPRHQRRHHLRRRAAPRRRRTLGIPAPVQVHNPDGTTRDVLRTPGYNLAIIGAGLADDPRGLLIRE